MNEATMPTKSFDVLLLAMSHAGPLGKRSVTAVMKATQRRQWTINSDDLNVRFTPSAE
jgi:hypothetical protein